VHKIGDSWEASIRAGGKSVDLGTFSTKLGAAKARVEAEKQYGYVDCDRLSEAQIFVNSQLPEEFDSRIRKISSSGFPGVYWNKQTGKWKAKTYNSGIQKYLGSFNTIEEAVEARENYLNFGRRELVRKPLQQSGVVGVSWNKKNRKWVARIKTVYLGSFNSVEEAQQAQANHLSNKEPIKW